MRCLRSAGQGGEGGDVRGVFTTLVSATSCPFRTSAALPVFICALQESFPLWSYLQEKGIGASLLAGSVVGGWLVIRREEGPLC